MPESSSAKTRFALLPGHDECRHLDSRHTFTPSRRDAPEALLDLPPNRGRGERRMPNAPAASCAIIVVERTRVTTSTPKSPGIPARNGFNGFLRALVTGLVCHRRQRIWPIRTRSGRPASEDLTPTTEASGPHDF